MKLNLQLLNLQKKLACADHTYQLSQLQSAYDSISAGNDGKGNISVYAKNDGKVSKVSVKAGDNVEEGSDILQITGNSTDVLLVQVKDSNSYKVYKDNIADVGERVSLCLLYTSSLVSKGRLKIDVAAEEANVSLGEFEKSMEEAGYKIPELV